MLLYKAEGIIKRDEKSEKVEEINEFDFKCMVSTKSEEFFYQTCNTESFYFVVELDGKKDKIGIGIIANEQSNVEENLKKYLKSIDIALKNVELKEITINDIIRHIIRAYRFDFINDDEVIMEKYGLDKIHGRRSGFEYSENMVSQLTQEQVLKSTQKYLMCETFVSELNRIYENKMTKKIIGHPVHYMIQTDDRENRKEVCRLLLNSLYSQNRIKSKRYTFMDIRATEKFSVAALDTLYNLSCGGAVVIRYITKNNMEDDDYASGERDNIERICSVVKAYQNQTLTILCLPRECKKVRTIFVENLGSMTFVEIKEEFAKDEQAQVFLKQLAKENGVRADKKLFSKIEEDTGYLAPQLRSMFNDWYNEKLKTTIYPQYKDLLTVKTETIKALPKGSAYDELQNMIGLTEAKSVIQKALNYYKMQKLYEEKGIKNDSPAMHMVFTGNPGTAKTTAARLFASIMKDNNLVSKGQLIEVGRGDLVGKYVGWTAQVVQSKFKDAIGGVLFIDEAYSLVDDRNGSFGDEAINTIVQEMENHREDVVVIFAGYPDKMESFLKKNPGLRSRVAFHVEFADYNPKELCQIAILMGKSKGINFEDDAINKLELLFEKVCKQSDFGNGRYVRNIIEQAKMNQATRLLEYDFDDITTKEITTIKAVDIIVPEYKIVEKRKIGFAS